MTVAITEVGSLNVTVVGAPAFLPVSVSVTPGMASDTVFEADLIGKPSRLNSASAD